MIKFKGAHKQYHMLTVELTLVYMAQAAPRQGRESPPKPNLNKISPPKISSYVTFTSEYLSQFTEPISISNI